MVIRIQTRLALLVAVVILSFLAGTLILTRSEYAKVHEIIYQRCEEKRALVNELANLYSTPSRTLAFDYSFWDETVEFVHHPDSAWAQENIDVGLATFKSSAAWVFDSARHLVYFTADSQHTALGDDSGLSSVLVGSLAEQWFDHFFCVTRHGVLEVFTAPIQPSADSKRETRPQGHLVVGRVLDLDYVKRIEAIAELKTVLIPTNAAPGEAPPGVIQLALPLLGRQGDTVAIISCSAPDPLYTTYARASQANLIVLLVSGFTITALVFGSLFFWVSRPLSSISSALEQADVDQVAPLAESRSEFGQMAKLIRDFFEQRSELQHQIYAESRARRALADSEKRYRVVAEQTGQIVYDWNVATGHIHWAGAIEVLTGFTSQEYQKVDVKTWEARIHSDDRASTMARLLEAASTGGHFEAEYRLQRKDGSYLVLEDNGVCIRGERGEPVRMLGTMRDITERRLSEARNLSLQDRLDRAQRMESVAVLAGGVAHDLNNMLGPVVGYSELLLRTIPQDTKQAGQLKRILKAARDAADVIQDLLALARRGRYEPTPVHLSEVVASFLESTGLLRLQERHPLVQIRSHLAEKVDLILGSRTHLEKVLMNLVANGCEAMPDGGVLTIDVEERFLESLMGGMGRIERGHYVLVRVSDTGRGIDPRDLPRIFEPYFSKKQLGHSGSGLGLSVVYGVVKDHGGYYDVFSELGQGTEFVLYFPSCDAAQDKEQVAEQVAEGGAESILIVDDSQDQREMAYDMITSLGYQVYSCASGREAVGFLQVRQVDLLVLDMIMEPDFDGLATYREAIKLRPGQRAVIVTGFSASDNVLEMQRLGAGVCLRKPYTLEAISQAIRDELRPVRVQD